MNTTDLLTLYQDEKREFMDDLMRSNDETFTSFKDWKRDYLDSSDATFVNVAHAVGNENGLGVDFTDDNLYTLDTLEGA